MIRFVKHILLITLVVASWGVFAQQGTNPVGVNFIIVNFQEAPTAATLQVYQAPLKYNKTFALSMQIDDADITLFTHGYPVFQGGMVNGTSYPGFFYSDGCGNMHNFKMGASVFCFTGSAENGPDIHVDNSYGQISWDQMNTIYNQNWGIYNHAVNGDSGTDPTFIDYSIKRAKSYIRRNLYSTTEGGVMTDIFVNPNGQPAYSQPAFDLGYIGALNQRKSFPLGDNGGNVNNSAVDWSQPDDLFRNLAEDVVMVNYIDGLADSSVNGANYWGPVFTHSLTDDYAFPTFVSDFNYIANTYGASGLDNILMTTDEEILDYLIVRDNVTMNYVINGSSMFITYSGEVPDDLRFYSSSIVIESDAVISNIIIDGNDDFTYTGVGETNALINLNWDGKTIIADSVLADSMVTEAVASQSNYNCWIAMDYVITMENGNHKDSLRQILCDIPGVGYDDGFCDCEITLEPADTTIQYGDCVELFGAVGDYSWEWFIEDSLIATTQDIYPCPEDTTVYIHVATNSFGCPAKDSIQVNINFLSFDLGNDTTLCSNNCIDIDGPPDMVEYTWYVADTVFDTVQTITACPLDTTMYTLWVEDENGAIASDSIEIAIIPSPILVFENDTISTCVGVDTETGLTAEGDIVHFIWTFLGNDTITFTPEYTIVDPDTSGMVYVSAEGENGCISMDSVYLWVRPYPELTFESDTIRGCFGIDVAMDLVAEGDIDSLIWTYNGVDTVTYTQDYTIVAPVDSGMVYVAAVGDSICSKADSVYLAILPFPELSISPDTSICKGDSIQLKVSGGIYYRWIAGNDTISNDSVVTVIPDSSTYYIGETAMVDSFCFARDTVIVNISPLPETKILYDTNLVCQYSEVILTASGAEDYLWIPDSVTNDIYSFVINDTTKVWLEGKSVFGCSFTDSVVINMKEGPVVSFSGLFSVYCENDPASELIGTPPDGTFSGPGIVGDNFIPASAGEGVHEIIYTYENDEGCAGMDTVVTTVYGNGGVIDLGPDITLTPDESEDIDAGSGFDSYFWTTGETLQSITVYGDANDPGTYEYAVIGVINGCSTRGSVMITFEDADGVAENTISNLRIFPNPSFGNFRIEFDSYATDFDVKIVDIHGVEIFEESEIACYKNCSFSIDIPKPAAGIYFLKINTAEGVVTAKVVVN